MSDSDLMDCSMPGFPVLHYLLELAQAHDHWVDDAIQPSHLLLPSSPSALHLSQYQGFFFFSSESALRIKWPKCFSFSISPSNEYSELISFRIDWFDLLAEQGTLKSLLQHHNLKASIVQHSAFCMVQLSHPYMTTAKAIALTRRTFVVQVMSLLLKALSLFFTAFLPRSKHLLISWQQSLSIVILKPPQNKTGHCFHFFPIYFPMKWWDQKPWS